MKNFSAPLPTNIDASVDTFAADMNKIVVALQEIRSNIPATADDVASVSVSQYDAVANRITALESAVLKLENPGSTGATVPSSPSISSVVAGDTTATVYFNAPANNGGSAVSKYMVYASNGKVVEGTASPITVTGLTNGTAVTFSVAAVNTAGNSTPSASSTSVTPTNVSKPAAPSNVTITNADGAVTVGWNVPSTDGGSTITGYRVSLDSTRTVDLTSTARTQTFSNLVNGQSYSITVAAINANGVGPAIAVTGKPVGTTIPSTAAVAPSSAFVTTGTWETGSSGEIYSKVVGATATLTFTGTYFELSAITDVHHTSISIKIDSGSTVTLSEQSSARNSNAVIYVLGNLASGTHTATVTVLSATAPTATILSARVASYTTSSTGGGTTTPPATTNPVSGIVRLNTASAGLLLNGKAYKYVGYNAVNMLGPTNSQRQITSDSDYYKNYAAGMTDRVWALPGSSATRLDGIIQAAKANGSRVIITLFDALGSGGPKWADTKANFGSYKSHVTTICSKYKDEPTIAAWEIANEPPNDREGFDLIGKAIKDADPNHLVCTGTLAVFSDSGVPAFQTAGSSAYVDILSMHEYDSLTTGASSHLARILPVARTLKKPIIIGEFGIDANADGSGNGNTGNNGATTFAGRANLIRTKTDAYLGTAEVCGVNYWSIGQSKVYDSADSYMWLGETAGTNAMKTASAKWSKNAN